METPPSPKTPLTDPSFAVAALERVAKDLSDRISQLRVSMAVDKLHHRQRQEECKMAIIEQLCDVRQAVNEDLIALGKLNASK